MIVLYKPSDLDPIRIIDFKAKDLSLGKEGKGILVSASKYLLIEMSASQSPSKK